MHSPEFRYAPWSVAKAVDLLKHVGPVILIAGLGGVARNLRVMRGNLLDVLNQQYVTTARSKGLHERRVLNRHAVPNALHPIIAYQGTVLPYMLQGELEAAIVFGLPTIAPMFAEALLKQDVFLSGSIMLLYGILLIAGNFIADMALGVLDPRISYS
jgi:peptide/nickel transport system permease protein